MISFKEFLAKKEETIDEAMVPQEVIEKISSTTQDKAVATYRQMLIDISSLIDKLKLEIAKQSSQNQSWFQRAKNWWGATNPQGKTESLSDEDLPIINEILCRVFYEAEMPSKVNVSPEVEKLFSDFRVAIAKITSGSFKTVLNLVKSESDVRIEKLQNLYSKELNSLKQRIESLKSGEVTDEVVPPTTKEEPPAETENVPPPPEPEQTGNTPPQPKMQPISQDVGGNKSPKSNKKTSSTKGKPPKIENPTDEIVKSRKMKEPKNNSLGFGLAEKIRVTEVPGGDPTILEKNDIRQELQSIGGLTKEERIYKGIKTTLKSLSSDVSSKLLDEYVNNHFMLKFGEDSTIKDMVVPWVIYANIPNENGGNIENPLLEIIKIYDQILLSRLQQNGRIKPNFKGEETLQNDVNDVKRKIKEDLTLLARNEISNLTINPTVAQPTGDLDLD